MKVLIPYTIGSAELTSHSVPETDYAAWSAATAYVVGARCIRTTTHRVYERLVAGTTATSPESDTTNWFDVGPTNAWAMFDESVGTYTTATSSITVQLALGAVADIVLLGVIGSNVAVTKPGGSVVNAAVPAAVDAAEGSIVKLLGIGGAAGTYTVSITGSGTVKAGIIALGTLNALGDTAYGATLGIDDHSTATWDQYGTLDIVQRGYARQISARISLPASALDATVTKLASLRSRALVWIGADTLASTVVFGFLENWELTLRALKAEGSITIKGLSAG